MHSLPGMVLIHTASQSITNGAAGLQRQAAPGRVASNGALRKPGNWLENRAEKRVILV